MRRFAALLALLGFPSCGARAPAGDRAWRPEAASDLGPVVARVGEIPIYASQVLAEAKQTKLQPRAALDGLIERYLLAEQARHVGLAPAAVSDPEVRSVLVQRMLERELEPRQRADAMPEPVLRAVYDRAKDAFVHPRLVEIAMLAIYTGGRMAEESRQERRQNAQALLAHLHAHPPQTLEAFRAVAADPAWASQHVVFDRFLQSPDRPLSPKVGREIVKLRSEGETTGLLADDDGFYIARYIAEQPAVNTTFEQAREKLLAAAFEHWQQQQFLDFTNALMQAHKVEAFFDRLPLNEQGP